MSVVNRSGRIDVVRVNGVMIEGVRSVSVVCGFDRMNEATINLLVGSAQFGADGVMDITTYGYTPPPATPAAAPPSRGIRFSPPGEPE